MTIPNTSRTPAVWNDDDLEEHAQKALEEFVDRRLSEPRERYTVHIAQHRAAIERLFHQLADIDPKNPDPATVRAILLDDDLLRALRYVTGPPTSEDDLGVLVMRSASRLTKTRLKESDELPVSVLQLICQLADPVRFPWVGSGRPPQPHEIKLAIRATTALHASQSLQTERRSYGKEVERQFENHLIAQGFTKARSPARGIVSAPKHYPGAKSFYGECTVYGRKVDLLLALEDGRVVAVEAKDSSSVTNSVKRVMNDTAAKAKHWHSKAGEQIIPVALLSGVFGLENLKDAQRSGLYLVWTHDLGSFTDWLATQ